MSINRQLYSFSMLCAAAPLALSVASAAQEAEAPAAGEEYRRLGTVTVQSQRREESIQSVPIAVTALSDEFVESNDVRTLEDLSGTVPGLVTTRDVGYGTAPLSIRGIGGVNGGGNTFADEPVAIYLNDVYIARSTLNTTDLLDIESIEVLRGPQGTLYGRNATAGALVIQTKKPTYEFVANFNATIAEYDAYRVSGAVSGPLSETVAGRIAVGYSDRAGFGTNTVTGLSIGGSEGLTLRGSLRFEPSSALTIDLIGEHQEQDSNPALIAVTGIGSTGGFGSPFVIRPNLNDILNANEFQSNAPSFVETESSSLTLLADWDLGAVTLDLVTGFYTPELLGAQDSDGTGLQLFTNNGDIKADQFSQEFRLSSDASDNFSWVLGAYYFQEEIDQLFAIQNFNGLFGLGTNAQFDASNETTSYAVFVDGIYNLTDKFSLTHGARWSYEEKDFTNTQVIKVINAGSTPPIPGPLGGLAFAAGDVFVAPPPAAFSDDFEDFSPRIVLDYQATPDALFGQNISDNRNITQVAAIGGFPKASVNEPRKWGLQFKVGY